MDEDFSAANDGVTTARYWLQRYRDHIGVARQFPRALSGPTALDLEDAVVRVATWVGDECQRARGTDPVDVASARARIDELCALLEEICRELAWTEPSA